MEPASIRSECHPAARAIPRRTLLAGGVATALLKTLPAVAQTTAAAVVLDDASRLNAVSVARQWQPQRVTGEEWLEALRAELRAAAAEGRAVAVGAARHSMGGQALARGGVAMTFDVGQTGRDRWLEADRDARTYRVAAGARWRQVVTALDPLGWSPAVMQSNNDFGVAATLSVNAHGWSVPYGPFGTTVRSFRLMLASGDLVTCSPTENSELFALAIGGYGLLGVVVGLEVSMVENVLLRPTHELLPAAELGPGMVARIAGDTTVQMMYGRLAVDARRFLRESVLVTYRPVPGKPLAATSGGLAIALTREVFRAQVGSDNAKRRRWYAETIVAPKASSGIASRNRLLNEPVAHLAGRDRSRTDILHEYFVPADALEAFLDTCRRVIPGSRQDLLNVTLRYVAEDRASVLAYARGARVAAVMFFSQRMTQAHEEDMAAMTRRLIDAALDAGGSFYLPYRLHARPNQLARAYPRLEEFLDGKRRYDPRLLFRNLMWDRYFAT
jgi:FAD/FMN-containing dehydrogenase